MIVIIANIHLNLQVRSAPRLVSDESILPHTPDLWKRGLILLAKILFSSSLQTVCQGCVSGWPGRPARARMDHLSANLWAPKWTVGKIYSQPPSFRANYVCSPRCSRPSRYPLNGQDCAVWICDGEKSAFNPIGHWTCMGFC